MRARRHGAGFQAARRRALPLGARRLSLSDLDGDGRGDLVGVGSGEPRGALFRCEHQHLVGTKVSNPSARTRFRAPRASPTTRRRTSRAQRIPGPSVAKIYERRNRAGTGGGGGSALRAGLRARVGVSPGISLSRHGVRGRRPFTQRAALPVGATGAQRTVDSTCSPRPGRRDRLCGQQGRRRRMSSPSCAAESESGRLSFIRYRRRGLRRCRRYPLHRARGARRRLAPQVMRIAPRGRPSAVHIYSAPDGGTHAAVALSGRRADHGHLPARPSGRERQSSVLDLLVEAPRARSGFDPACPRALRY